MNITVNSKKTLDEISVIAKDVVVSNKVAKSQVVAVFDVSGSMEDMYDSGIVKALATRVLALGLELDDNGIIPVYALSEGCKKLKDLTAKNLDSYVDDNLVRLVGGGTNYAPSINAVVKDAEVGDPMIVLLFTDGENYDQDEAEEALVEASKLPIFFQWYGIYGKGRQPSFGFLHDMDEMDGRTVDNAGFSPLGLSIVHDSNHSNDDDKSLYEDMLKEYKDFPQKAMMAGSNWTNLHQVKSTRRKLFGLF